MKDAVVFQPEWNGRPKRQFRHLDTFSGPEQSQMEGVPGMSATAPSTASSSKPGRFVRSFVKGKCICLECGHEFGVQREGAMYLCERCTAKMD